MTRHSPRPLMVAAACALVGLMIPTAAASHWCASQAITVQPETGFAGDRTAFAINVTNNSTLDVNATAYLRPSWEPQYGLAGTVQLAARRSALVNASKYLPAAPGEYSLTIQLQGASRGATGVQEPSANCAPIVRPLRVDALPPSPVVVATASRTSSPVPEGISFAAFVSGGVLPLVAEWRFGDGATATGSNATHEYASAGTYVAQVTVMDSRGRLAQDRITITVLGSGAAASGAGLRWLDAIGDPSFWLLVVVLGFVVASHRRHRRVDDSRRGVQQPPALGASAPKDPQDGALADAPFSSRLRGERVLQAGGDLPEPANGAVEGVSAPSPPPATPVEPPIGSAETGPPSTVTEKKPATKDEP